jgi:hypothetical protein
MDRAVHGKFDLLENLPRQHDEEHRQDGAAPLLQLVNEFVSEKTNGTLKCEDDDDANGERDMKEDLGRLCTKEADQPVPGDRAEPLHRGRNRNGLAERQSGQWQLAHPGRWAPQCQIRHGERPKDHPNDNRRESRPESEAQRDGQRAREDRGEFHVRGEPDREITPRRAVASVFGYRGHAV